MNYDTIWFTVLPIVFGMAVVALIFVIAIKYVKGIQKLHDLEQCPVQTFVATVREKKQTETIHRKLSWQSPGSFDTEERQSYFVSFQIENSEMMGFSVDEELFSLLLEGDQGLLTVQKDRLLSFERTK